MALIITTSCSTCDACRDECPTQAITKGKPYLIDPGKCVECVGFFDTPQCVDMCPVKNCIIPDVANSLQA